MTALGLISNLQSTHRSGLRSGLNAGGQGDVFGARINACATVMCRLVPDRVLGVGVVDATATVAANMNVSVPLAVGTIDATATVSATMSAGSSTGTIDDIMDAADPMQALIDAMGYSTKPDFMWLGNQASGDIIDLGPNGADLTTLAVDYQRTSASLGGTNNCVRFNGNSDRARSADTSLDFGTSDFTIIHIFEVDTWTANEYLISNRLTDGWSIRLSSTDALQFIMDPTGGIPIGSVTGHVVDEPIVMMFRREVGAVGGAGLYTNRGSSVLDDPGGDINSPSEFAIGDGASGTAANSTWAMTAIFSTSDITDTHRQALSDWLEYSNV